MSIIHLWVKKKNLSHPWVFLLLENVVISDYNECFKLTFIQKIKESQRLVCVCVCIYIYI